MAGERAVVVGAGGISRAWFPPLIDETVDVTAVVDLNVKAAEERIATYGLDAEASDDLKTTLKRCQPDFVVDLTVPKAHCKVTCEALAAGCHVIGEKPMANSMAEARKMVRAAEKADRLYMVSQSRRWNPMHETARRQLTKQRFGTLSSATCDFFLGAHFGGFRAEMDSPLILDMSIHHFDLMRFITGTDPVAVYAHEWNPPGSWYEGDVAASCIFEMTDGVTFSYRGSWCAEGRQTSWNGDWRFQGERGSMVYAQDELPVVEVVAARTGFHRGCKPLKVRPASVKHLRMHGALREMLAYLRRGTVPQTECHDNIKSLAMVFAAIESSRKGRRVEIKTGV